MEPTKLQAELLEKIRKAGALCTQKVEPYFYLPGGDAVDCDRARTCIRNGWLVPNEDGLFGSDPQTYRAA
jgi:hypothetical protein